jgi:hypothetical protein
VKHRREACSLAGPAKKHQVLLAILDMKNPKRTHTSILLYAEVKPRKSLRNTFGTIYVEFF